MCDIKAVQGLESKGSLFHVNSCHIGANRRRRHDVFKQNQMIRVQWTARFFY